MDQRARRTGIATALMAECAARAQEAGGSALYLHTASFMPAATALYARLGYRRDPVWDFDAGAHFGLGQRLAVVATAFRLDLGPTCRVVRPGDTYEGRQMSTSRQVYPTCRSTPEASRSSPSSAGPTRTSRRAWC